MTLPASGPISLGNNSGDTTTISVNRELGKVSPYQQVISLNDTAVRTLAGVGPSGTTISLSSLRGKSSTPLKFTLTNPTHVASDHFGYSVAISGNYAIVGAYLDDTGASNAGSAYIYNITTGALVHTLNNPTPAVNDKFGFSVAISGNYAIVGAYSDDTGASNAGSAYIYNITTGALVHTLNNPTPAVNDKFGSSVAISGNYAIVGAWFDDTGASNAGSAYIYNITTGALVHTLNNPTPAANDFFGSSVAISGNYAIVGAYSDDTGASNAGSAYIYNITTGALVHTLNNPTPAVNDKFGSSVAISGNYAIVGAWFDDTGASNAGSAYIYNITTGALVHTLNNPTPAANDFFGSSVAISGNYAIVGAWFDDTGASNAGSAYIYNITTGALVHTLNNPTPAVNDKFGSSVAISGNYAIVGAWFDDTGASNAGSAYIYNITTGALVHTLNNPTPAANDFFGSSVAISGNYAIVGAYLDDTGATDAGSAYIYSF